MPDQDNAENPEYTPKQIVEEKLRVIHRCHSRNERRKSTNYRKISRQRNGFASVPRVKGVSLLEVFTVKNPGVITLEKPSSENRSNPIIESVTQKSSDREQNQDKIKLKMLCRSGQSANRKKESVSWKKRCDDQSTLAENDQEQQQIGPSPDLQGQLIQVIVQMEKEINGIPLHTKKARYESGDVSAKRGPSATEIVKCEREKEKGSKEKFKRNPASLRLTVRT
jgi:hypothetical protein